MKALRHFVSTIIYVLVLYLLLWLNNIGINWLLTHVIAGIFDWFYDIWIGWKILLIIFGGVSIVTFIFNLFRTIGLLINLAVSSFFVENIVVRVISYIMCIANIILLEIVFFDFFKWDFWIVCMWLMISTFIIQSNWMFIYKKIDED